MSTQQVKALNSNTLSPLWTLGQSGGYLTNSTVANDKFAFKDITGFSYSPYLAYAPDGSFWVGDAGNYRALHFSASRTFIERIMFLQNTYSSTVDPNDSTRVFANYLEFKIDYSKPLDNGKNGSWELKRNWGPGFNSRQFGGDFDPTERLRKIVTLSNGRTYGILRSTKTGPGGYPLMEFISRWYCCAIQELIWGQEVLLIKTGHYINNSSGFIIGYNHNIHGSL